MNANLKKAWYYCKRNGLRNTFFAALERMSNKNNDCYEWTPLTKTELAEQRQHTFANLHTFSILVPAYETDARFLRQMIESVMVQTYARWELIIADASKTEAVETVVHEYLKEDGRIIYTRLADNRGISHNTNEALALAKGDYIGLLDHDDVLTPDALHEMALRIEVAEQGGTQLQLLYSDEDKCDTDMQHYYEPHFKEEFNLDLILSNNYICHFLVMKAELMKNVRFQPDYDGAQDYKLVLDAVAAMIREAGDTFAPERQTAHIPKVLYHWRCHTGSTAQNPQSKLYAYEAGKRAVQSFCDAQGWQGAAAEHMRHLGFYKVRFYDIFAARKDVGAVGGSVVRHGRIWSGSYTALGTVRYLGLPVSFSGYMHRAVLQQDADALDLRCITARSELKELLLRIQTKYGLTGEALRRAPEETVRQASLEFAAAVHAKGYRMLWNPDIRCRA